MNAPCHDDNVTRNAGEDKPGERMEQKCEEWVKDIDNKADNFTRKMPPPVNALLDAVCLSVFLAGSAWLCRKLGWIEAMPSWTTLAILFGAIFALSLLIRLLVKNSKNRK
ncbi:MAG: hypothetical protein WC299_13870 [Kiritimatiellia bacterium]